MSILPLRRMLLLACLASAPAQAIDTLDPRDFDSKTAACTDLYQFANGGWLKRTPVPAGQLRINRFTELQQRVQQQRLHLVQALLNEPPSQPWDTPLQALLQSARNETALAAASQTALAALLPAIADAKRPSHVEELIASYHSRGLPLLFRAEDDRDGRIALRVELLTLPDPAFYLDTAPAAREWLGRYRSYVETLLGLAGSQDVATESAWVIDFESKIAQALAAAGSGQPLALSAKALHKRHPALGWKPLLKDLGLQQVEQFNVYDEAALAAANGMVSSAHPVQWRAWLRYRVVHLLAPYLDAPFRDAHAQFIRTGLRGEALAAEVDERALDVARRLLGDGLGQRYAERFVAAPRQQAAEQLVGELRLVLQKAIEANTRWEPGTRERALAKLQALRVDFGRGTGAADPATLKLSADNLVGNVLAISRWRLNQLGKGVSAPASGVDALQAQLGYRLEDNRLLLSPALLQPPLFDESAELPLRYAGLGALIAHELAHGFDLGGANFDAEGKPQPWWSEADRAAWQSSVAPLISQYASYPAVGLRRMDGERTLAENAADLSAVQLAFTALQAAQADLKLPLRDGLSPAQRFFVGWASLWRENALDAARQQDADRGEFSPSRARAIGPLPHLPAFASSFACKPKSAMLGSGGKVTPWP